MMNVCIFAASSNRIDNVYFNAATELGTLLAEAGMTIIYGGGGIGLMGKLADAALEKGGSVTGVIPSFMVAEGWSHKQVSDMVVTVDMGERKKWLFDHADAVVALPGGINRSNYIETTGHLQRPCYTPEHFRILQYTY